MTIDLNKLKDLQWVTEGVELTGKGTHKMMEFDVTIKIIEGSCNGIRIIASKGGVELYQTVFSAYISDVKNGDDLLDLIVYINRRCESVKNIGYVLHSAYKEYVNKESDIRAKEKMRSMIKGVKK